jgi:NADH dehydrogenase
LAKKLNKLADRRLKYQNIFPDDETVYDSFKYVHRGSLAYIGNAAIADFGNGYAFGGSGAVAKYLWRGVYWNEQVSIRTRMLLALDWAKELIFGRDVSRI